MIATPLLTRIMDIHHDPKQFVIQEHPLTDATCNIPTLGRYVQEDKDAWFIKHEGKYVMYCTKRSRAMPDDDGNPIHLERMLAEMWGRYTRKQMNPNIDYGFRV